jgi:hypothetical protein
MGCDRSSVGLGVRVHLSVRRVLVSPA